MRVHEAVDKRFLNMEPNEGGSVAWSVILHKSSDCGHTGVTSNVRLTDCFNYINLDFDYSTPAAFRKRVDKLDSLIASLLSCRDALFEARDKKIDAIIKHRQEKKGERFASKEDKEASKAAV